MSIQLIQQYHAQVDRIIRYGGSRNESSIRKPFQDLLEHYAHSKSLELIPELEYRTPSGSTVYPDGTLKDALRQEWGFWESKDQHDDLASEIQSKFARGYPTSNILFEDSHTAILYQAGKEVGRAALQDDGLLDALLSRFVSYQPKAVREFREAIERFGHEVPALAEDLRGLIEEQYVKNQPFRQAAHDFLTLCQESINPNVELADVREMIIQHILTQDIFTSVFAEPQFHLENAVARRLGEVIATFYSGPVRRAIHQRIADDYAVINARAAAIANHHEKQKFLKALYETFYKAYNPKGADRLGIVYTPNEIVRFMIEAADQLCFQHFGKTLGSPGVEILDPATGTGTFITELIEYLPPHLLEHKYRHELHCNEVAILPYYIANLNIEYTYKQKMGQYVEFENILFVDTLDNLGFAYANKQYSLFGLSEENAERIRRQNERKISVIIGNPPYNANQMNENENNKNREYPGIDKDIKATYIKQSTAQKTKLYDMYARFLRWASNRLAENGIIAFITNRSFLDSRTYDGFRKVVAEEFSHIYVVDLGGDVRKNPKLSGPKHNVFAIQTGVAISFLVKRRKAAGERGQILYPRRPETETAIEKLRFLANNPLRQIAFQPLQPDATHNWLNQTENDWESLLPVASKETKLARKVSEEQAIFKLFSLGVVTARDEWVYDLSHTDLQRKMGFLMDVYNADVTKHSGKIATENIKDVVDYSIKWTRAVKHDLDKGMKYTFADSQVTMGLYRPFFKQFLYFSSELNEMQYQLPEVFRNKNTVIGFTDAGSEKPFMTLVTDYIPDYHLVGAGCATQCLPLYRYDTTGQRVDNITDWALAHFQQHYSGNSSPDHSAFRPPHSAITKTAIFHYVYAVLHNPAYRQKYELNLKRDLPRIPLYADFWQWAAWGERLLDLHLHYESIDPYPLERREVEAKPATARYQAKLKADKQTGIIELDTLTTLHGVPSVAWHYLLGNRSALEWVLDRYKERKPSDPTIREKFDTYRLADYKEQVIDLLGRVTAVSVETMKVIDEMKRRELP